MNFVEYPDREVMMMRLADMIASSLENALFTHEQIALAVAGGTTPGPVFDALCAAKLDWSRVHVMPTDERWVPETDARSNARLIRERLLVERAAEASYLSLYAEGQDPEAALPDLQARLEPVLPLAVVMLGMGGDMHTASLFPGTQGLEAALADDAQSLAVLRPESQPETRISLTAPVLRGAMERHLLITGAEKRAALERASTLPPTEAPVQSVLNGMNVHWAE